ncbi:hypothetical protein BH10PLA2_BH10PLA2_00170 [soil metagenome]
MIMAIVESGRNRINVLLVTPFTAEKTRLVDQLFSCLLSDARRHQRLWVAQEGKCRIKAKINLWAIYGNVSRSDIHAAANSENRIAHVQPL